MGVLLGLFLLACLTAPVFALLGYFVGSRHEAGGTGAILGALFGPIGVLVAFALDDRAVCPQCHGRLDGQPRVCPHCRTLFLPPWQPAPGASPFQASTPASLPGPPMIPCPGCGLFVQDYAAGCPACGFTFSPRD